MRITPRAHEVRRVVDILEDSTFEGPEQLAKAVIKEVAEIVQMRDLFVLKHTWSDGRRGLNLGPFGSVAEGEAFAKRMSFGGTGRIIPLTSSGVMLANHDGKTSWPGYCWDPECGHAPWAHALDGASRGGCRVDVCKCGRFVKDDPAVKKKAAKVAKGRGRGVNEL